MLNVEVSNYGFEAKGHADYARRGQDIVCASASTVALFTIELLQKHSELSKTVQTGEVRVTIHEPNESTNEVMRTYHKFMHQLENQYPKHIKVFGGIRH